MLPAYYDGVKANKKCKKVGHQETVKRFERSINRSRRHVLADFDF